jgi:hypothetical protein
MAYMQNEHRTKKSEHLEANMFLAKNEYVENKHLAMDNYLVNSLKIKHPRMNLCDTWRSSEYLEA